MSKWDAIEKLSKALAVIHKITKAQSVEIEELKTRVSLLEIEGVAYKRVPIEGPSIATWEHCQDPDGTAYDWFRCSKCRQIAPGNYKEMDKCNYCPNCGFKIKK